MVQGCAKQLPVQIWVVVASIQMGSWRSDVEREREREREGEREGERERERGREGEREGDAQL